MDILVRSRAEKSHHRLDKLVSLLRCAPGGRMTVRDLKNSHGFDHEELAELTRDHPNLLKSAKLQNPNGGRPSPVITLISKEASEQ